ncbi:hypothetical protein RI129_011763 [Pyrocoelia pectoralis]|uniref:Uncharacterized protein n=1 Tax=Pyrocoelia pectoralis TaxID=417401 RepID=A0AAN7V6B2_9COLE
MERSESSDSDSNSSTSWVFVSDNSSPIENNTNTFHLDCSREPIQELTEQDFVSAGSDIETESDGVSIISETDVSSEEYENKTDESTSESKHECDTLYGDTFILKKVDTSLLSQVKRFLRGSNIVGVGVVLTAVFLGSYSFKKVTVEDTGDFISNNDLDKKDYTNFLCKNSANLGKNLEEIVDITIACTYTSSESKVLIKSKEIKQCVMDKYKTKVSKSPKENENNKIQSLLNSIEKSTENTCNSHTLRQFEAKRNKRMGDDLVNAVMSKGSQKKYDSSKPSVIKKSKEKPYLKIVKDFNNSVKRYPSKKNCTSKEHKVEKSKLPKVVKEFNKSGSSKKNRTSKEHKVESGEWYMNLHKARQRLRKQASDHDVHITKGIKNKWYFKWMNGREQLRRKSIYKPYSRYLNI